MRITAWASLDFLEEITSKSPNDYMDPDRVNSGSALFDMLELIRDGLVFNVNASNEQISVHDSNPYIKFLKKELRIKPATEDFIQLRANPDIFFEDRNKKIALFLLGKNEKRIVSQYQSDSGFYCVSPHDEFDLLFEEQIENFERNNKKSWSFAKRFFTPHNSLVIADPYLFKDASYKAMQSLLENIIPAKLKRTYHITLIGSDQNRKNDLPSKEQIALKVKETQKLISKQLPNSVVEHHIYNKEDFHDRYLMSNNTCVFSGYGLDLIKNNQTVQKESTWIALKPFKKFNINGKKGVLFYRLMNDKIKVIRKWVLDSNQNKSTNPLLE